MKKENSQENEAPSEGQAPSPKPMSSLSRRRFSKLVAGGLIGSGLLLGAGLNQAKAAEGDPKSAPKTEPKTTKKVEYSASWKASHTVKESGGKTERSTSVEVSGGIKW